MSNFFSYSQTALFILVFNFANLLHFVLLLIKSLKCEAGIKARLEKKSISLQRFYWYMIHQASVVCLFTKLNLVWYKAVMGKLRPDWHSEWHT